MFWLSRHGDVSLNGTVQYPGTTIAMRQAYWKAIQAVFAGKLVGSETPLSQQTMAQHWSGGKQVVIYASDYAQFTG